MHNVIRIKHMKLRIQ